MTGNTDYQRRNERAKAEGWKSYADKRSGKSPRCVRVTCPDGTVKLCDTAENAALWVTIGHVCEGEHTAVTIPGSVIDNTPANDPSPRDQHEARVLVALAILWTFLPDDTGDPELWDMLQTVLDHAYGFDAVPRVHVGDALNRLAGLGYIEEDSWGFVPALNPNGWARVIELCTTPEGQPPLHRLPVEAAERAALELSMLTEGADQ